MLRTLGLAAALIFFTPYLAGAIVSPRNGTRLPDAYYATKRENPGAYTLSRAWVRKLARIRDRRRVFLDGNPGAFRTLSSSLQVSDSLVVPVLLGEFSNRVHDVDAADLRAELFDGPWPTGTLTQYFDEVSYGTFRATGVVREWVQVNQSDVYYAGTSNGLSPGDARTGEFIAALLDSADAAVDFGAFDNDGPDGIPNSGDDDGFVDLLAIVHSESGGECGNANIWSHCGQYRFWPFSVGNAYTTNDTSLSGGFIRVDDYTIQPARACGLGMIEIGTFAHEFGHALGLPDLWDVDGGSSGIGDWGLMGTGNWNTPDSPAHPCAWTRQELGWVLPTDAGPQGAVTSLMDIESSAVCYKLSFVDDRFRRAGECAINGGFSLRCALDSAEAAIRGWVGASGYGNSWDESIERDFTFDGNLPVSFDFAFDYDIEPGYDVASASILVDGVETTLATYTGTLGGSANLDLSAVLAAKDSGAVYTLRFRVTSDARWSDEDGKYVSVCGAFTVDDVVVTGGGESYATGFETSVDGWHQEPTANPPTEYWLVENRQPVGFDANLHGGGLLIWHVDETVIRSDSLGNTGGPSNSGVRGLVLEEADGLFDLLQNPLTTGNSGDGGDPFPGTSGNTVFNSGSSPSSQDNLGRATIIEVTGIGASGSPMNVFLRAGDPAPTATAVIPDTIRNDLGAVEVCVEGSGMRSGATMRLVKSGETDIVATSVSWQDPGTICGTLDVFNRTGGSWDVVVTNPDGQGVAMVSAMELIQIVPAQLLFASIEPVKDGVEFIFELFDTEAEEVLVVSRSGSPVGPWVTSGERLEALRPNVFRYLDRAALSGRTYYYRLDVRSPDGDTRILYQGSATVPLRVVALDPNRPNPFNPTTTISYYLPEASNLRLDIFDVTGAHVRTLVSGAESPGAHEVKWDGRDGAGHRVGSGIYFYRLRVGRKSLTRKMLFLK